MATWRMYASSMSACGRTSSSVRHETAVVHSGGLVTSATKSQAQATKLISKFQDRRRSARLVSHESSTMSKWLPEPSVGRFLGLWSRTKTVWSWGRSAWRIMIERESKASARIKRSAVVSVICVWGCYCWLVCLRVEAIEPVSSSELWLHFLKIECTVKDTKIWKKKSCMLSRLYTAVSIS